VDLRDIFSTFGDILRTSSASVPLPHGAGPGRFPRRPAIRHEDSFLEAATGKETDIAIRRNITCEPARAPELKPGPAVVCPRAGTGQVNRSQGSSPISTTCSQCHGEEIYFQHPCKSGHGFGKVRSEKKIHIKIPAGWWTRTEAEKSGEKVNKATVADRRVISCVYLCRAA